MPTADFLALRILEIQAGRGFDPFQWKSLKAQLASTTAIDLSDVVAKLRVVHDGIELESDRLDLKILESAIGDLRALRRDR